MRCFILAVFVALCLTARCANATAPHTDLDLQTTYYPATEPYHQIVPPAWYQQEYDSTAACVATTQPMTGHKFSELRWFVIDTNRVRMEDGSYAAAYYTRGAIFITWQNAAKPWIVAHESVHASGFVWGHPPQVFTKCVTDRFPLDFPRP